MQDIYAENAAIADLGKIAENIREPYQGLFDEESAGENDSSLMTKVLDW